MTPFEIHQDVGRPSGSQSTHAARASMQTHTESLLAFRVMLIVILSGDR